MSSGRIAKHRNYGELMERHQRDLRIRRVAIACIYILIFTCLLAMYILVKKTEKTSVQNAEKTAWVTSHVDNPYTRFFSFD